MPATIRLKRVGKKKQAAFRIVVTDRSVSVDGPPIENLGVYQPRTDPSLVRLNAARTLHWLREGATPSETVRSLLRRTGVWEKFHAGVTVEELEETEILLGPPAGVRKTSRRSRAAEEAGADAEVEAGVAAGTQSDAEAGEEIPTAGGGAEGAAPEAASGESPGAGEGEAEEAERDASAEEETKREG